MWPTELSLYLTPSLEEHWTPAYSTTFTLDVEIANVGGLYGFEFKLYWNTTLLDLVGTNVTAPSVWSTNYFVGMNETREDLGRYWLAVTALNPAPPFCGSAALVTLAFKITYDPVYPENVTSALDLENSKLSDPDAQLIPHDAYDGEYWCYSTKPELAVTPPEFRTKKLESPFAVNVTVSDFVNLYSFKVKLSYNTTILDAVNIEVGSFIEKPYHIDKRIVDDTAGVVWLEVTSMRAREDVTAAALAFGSYPGHPNWNPNVDLKPDAVINIFDLVIIGVNFGKSCYDGPIGSAYAMEIMKPTERVTTSGFQIVAENIPRAVAVILTGQTTSLGYYASRARIKKKRRGL